MPGQQFCKRQIGDHDFPVTNNLGETMRNLPPEHAQVISRCDVEAQLGLIGKLAIHRQQDFHMPVAMQIWHDLRLVPLHDEASGLHFQNGCVCSAHLTSKSRSR